MSSTQSFVRDGAPSLDLVPLDPFREAFARRRRQGWTVQTVADRMSVNSEQVRILLGEKVASKTVRGKRYTRVQKRCTYDVGVRLCRALDVDPWQVGV